MLTREEGEGLPGAVNVQCLIWVVTWGHRGDHSPSCHFAHVHRMTNTLWLTEKKKEVLARPSAYGPQRSDHLSSTSKAPGDFAPFRVCHFS